METQRPEQQLWRREADVICMYNVGWGDGVDGSQIQSSTCAMPCKKPQGFYPAVPAWKLQIETPRRFWKWAAQTASQRPAHTPRTRRPGQCLHRLQRRIAMRKR